MKLTIVNTVCTLLVLGCILTVPLPSQTKEGERTSVVSPPAKAKLEESTVYTPQLMGVSESKSRLTRDALPTVATMLARDVFQIDPSELRSNSPAREFARHMEILDGWGSQVSITTSTANQRAPSIACDTLNNLYAAFEDYSTTYPYPFIRVYKSTDAGRTWQTFTGVYNQSTSLNIPSVAYSNGYVVLSYSRGDGAAGIARWSTDGSSSSFGSYSLPTPTVLLPSLKVQRVRMCGDAKGFTGDDYLYVVYLFSQLLGNPKVYFTRSTDDGASWSSQTELATTIDGYVVGDAGIDWGPSGLYVAYLGSGANDKKVMMRKSTNFGSAFGTETVVYDNTANKLGPVVAAYGANNVLMVVQKQFSTTDDDITGIYSTNGGGSWTNYSVAAGFSSERFPWASHDNGGNFYVTYTLGSSVYAEYGTGTPVVGSATIVNSGSSPSTGDFTAVRGFTGRNASGAQAAWVAGSSTDYNIYGNTYSYTTSTPTITWVTSPPSTITANNSYLVRWQVTNITSISHTNLHWEGPDSANTQNFQSGAAGTYSDTLRLSRTGTYEVFAHVRDASSNNYYGPRATVQVVGGAPSATTNAATNVAATSGTLNGSVNPSGSTTTAWFEWGTSSSLATSSATSSQSIGSG
ncbi:MAG TPA: hypothetical protein DCP63_13180, partial [Bacteroidetes bacterium]|nr:hypothetical protein [Bacteroidota bacterium]